MRSVLAKSSRLMAPLAMLSLDFAQVHKLRAELLRPLRLLVLVADYELVPELANALGEIEPGLELGGERA